MRSPSTPAPRAVSHDAGARPLGGMSGGRRKQGRGAGGRADSSSSLNHQSRQQKRNRSRIYVRCSGAGEGAERTELREHRRNLRRHVPEVLAADQHLESDGPALESRWRRRPPGHRARRGARGAGRARVRARGRARLARCLDRAEVAEPGVAETCCRNVLALAAARGDFPPKKRNGS